MHPLRFIRAHFVDLFITALFTSALFFTIQVEQTRRALRQTGEGSFDTGAVVTVVAAIDGDEVSIADDKDHRSVVRILGIKSFASKRNDVVTQRYGQRAFEHLKGLETRKVKLTLGDPPRDSRGRLLAYLEAVPDTPSAYDVGQQMVAQGIAMAFTKFPHKREDTYLKGEVQATRFRRGMWADAAVVQRMQALKALWQEKRE